MHRGLLKAFDRINNKNLFLFSEDWDWMTVIWISSQIHNETAVIRVDGHDSEALNSKQILRKVLDDTALGISINGQFLNNFRPTKDTLIFSTNLKDLQKCKV